MSNFQAFLDGATGAGLFGRRRWPGAPTELIDSRGPLSAHSPEAFAAPLKQIIHETWDPLTNQDSHHDKDQNHSFGKRIGWFLIEGIASIFKIRPRITGDLDIERLRTRIQE